VILHDYQQWIDSLPQALQYVAVVVLSMLPYIELHGAAVAGSISGINPVLSVLLSITGNFLIISVCTFFAEKLNNRLGKKSDNLSVKRKKLNDRFDKYGVAGASIFGWFILPSTIVAIIMVSVFKASKRKVMLWMLLSLLIWGVVIGSILLTANSILM